MFSYYIIGPCQGTYGSFLWKLRAAGPSLSPISSFTDLLSCNNRIASGTFISDNSLCNSLFLRTGCHTGEYKSEGGIYLIWVFTVQCFLPPAWLFLDTSKGLFYTWFFFQTWIFSFLCFTTYLEWWEGDGIILSSPTKTTQKTLGIYLWKFCNVFFLPRKWILMSR